jgi:hypothetical protein
LPLTQAAVAHEYPPLAHCWHTAGAAHKLFASHGAPPSGEPPEPADPPDPPDPQGGKATSQVPLTQAAEGHE